MEKKLAELKALQAEIRRLRKYAASGQALLISVQMLEVSPKVFQEAGDDLNLGGVTPGIADHNEESPASTSGVGRRIQAGTILDHRQLQERIKRWREKGPVTVIAEPKIVTVSGRSAQFLVGGAFPVPDKTNKCTFHEYGTRIDVVATAEDDETVQLDLRARFGTVDTKYEVVIEGQKVPGLWEQQIDTAAKLLPGQVLVAGTFAGNRPDVAGSMPDQGEKVPEKLGFIVLAQVDFVDGMPLCRRRPEHLVTRGASPEGQHRRSTSVNQSCPRPASRDARGASRLIYRPVADFVRSLAAAAGYGQNYHEFCYAVRTCRTWAE